MAWERASKEGWIEKSSTSALCCAEKRATGRGVEVARQRSRARRSPSATSDRTRRLGRRLGLARGSLARGEVAACPAAACRAIQPAHRHGWGRRRDHCSVRRSQTGLAATTHGRQAFQSHLPATRATPAMAARSDVLPSAPITGSRTGSWVMGAAQLLRQTVV